MIRIDLTSGNSFVKADDVARAEAAALKVIGSVDHEAAYAEYLRQFEELDSEDGMTGLAAVWADAIRAADAALTEGWADPSGASCTVAA